jgi:hypothetical protein
MEKRSKHYGDVQKWVEKVIDSCETYQQALTARRLIFNFEKQMRKNGVDVYFALSVISILQIRLRTKRQSFLNKIEND